MSCYDIIGRNREGDKEMTRRSRLNREGDREMTRRSGLELSTVVTNYDIMEQKSTIFIAVPSNKNLTAHLYLFKIFLKNSNNI